MLTPAIGGYEIKESLGERDGIATYRAASHADGGAVLLRIARTPSAEKRLRARARQALAAGPGPHVREVLALESGAGRVIVVSRDHGGWRLSDVARNGGFDPERANTLAAQLGHARASLQAAGMAPDVVDPGDVWIERRAAGLTALIDPVEAQPAAPGARCDLDRVMPLLVGGDHHRRIGSGAPAVAAGPDGSGLPIWLIAGGALAVFALAAVVALDDDDARPAAGAAVSVAEPRSVPGARITPISVPASVSAGPVFAGGRAWLADADQMTLLTLDPATGRLAGDRVEVGPGTGRPMGLRLGAGSLWAIDSVGGRVTRIDPEKRARSGRIETEPRIAAFTVDAEGAAIIRRDDSFDPERPTRLIRYDARTLRRRAATDLGRPATGATSAAGRLWVALGDGAIGVVDAGGRIAPTRDLGRSARITAVGLGALWVTDPAGRRLLRLDPESLRTIGTFSPASGENVLDADIGPRGLFVLLREPGPAATAKTSLQKLAPAALTPVGAPIALDAPAIAIVQSPEAVWASARGQILRVEPTD